MDAQDIQRGLKAQGYIVDDITAQTLFYMILPKSLPVRLLGFHGLLSTDFTV